MYMNFLKKSLMSFSSLMFYVQDLHLFVIYTCDNFSHYKKLSKLNNACTLKLKNF